MIDYRTIIFAFEPSITSDEMHDDTPAANKLISASSAKTILDIAVFAELASYTITGLMID
jgi:hypothetical protein